MKTTEFKVHTIYSREDILQMQKVTTAKTRRISLVVLGTVLVLFLAVVLWESSRGDGHASLIPSVSGIVLDAVLMAALVFALILVIALPYLQRSRILKAAPGGVLKANFYFYDKTFQYGWGDHFTTVRYTEIEEFQNLPNTFYMKARGVAYWVKKSDFVVGTPEAFIVFMKERGAK